MILRPDGVYQFESAHGVVRFHPVRPHIYAMDLDLPKGGANAQGVEFIRECLDAMFNETPALIIHGRIERANLASRHMSTVLKWRVRSELDDATHVHREITIARWIAIRGVERMAKAEARRPAKCERR